ncbi:MAG: hypothetical protein JXN61_00190 [Sedimentisphaerales bacterium]|nr:hypothetical protein [Sedimentisphaerales bacterium]
MNRLKLKVVGLVVLIFAMIVGVWFLRPGESPPASQVEKHKQTASKPQASTQKAKTTAESAAERAVSQRAFEFEKRKAAQLSSTAESLKTLYRNPGSPEAAKARQSLLKQGSRAKKPDSRLRGNDKYCLHKIGSQMYWDSHKNG